MNHRKTRTVAAVWLLLALSLQVHLSAAQEVVQTAPASAPEQAVEHRGVKSFETQEDGDSAVAVLEDATTSSLPTRLLEQVDTEFERKHQQQQGMKIKKKRKPMLKGKHKKKKQSFKDKMMPLMMIPVVLQIMTIPMMIMNLKMLAMKAILVGKLAMLLVILNAIRNWSIRAGGGGSIKSNAPEG
ncbi:uncharacterized protein LOC126844332 isoform X2 [Adelges cooleyi]|nr:uncharacterized protein LOC126844332 isoform X2 [Adelges cooleyi]